MGEVPVVVYAFDAAGQYDFCETYLILSPSTSCSNYPPGIVSGWVQTTAQMPVANVAISFSGDQPHTTPIPMLTGSSNGACHARKRYFRHPHYNEHPLNGVTTFDIVLIPASIFWGYNPWIVPINL
ncbi:MAG: hypothetical protein R2795_16880 [Saprospiraceae bacterium]